MYQIVLHSIVINKSGWKIRIDTRHGNKDYHKKHIHISKKGLKGEYSWNEDGTRHDKHRFPSNEHGIKHAKKLCEDMLGVPFNEIQFITDIKGPFKYIVECDGDTFSTYIHKNKVVTILGTTKGLVTLVASI